LEREPHPSPPFDLDSPVVAHLLDAWTHDETKLDYLRNWLRYEGEGGREAGREGGREQRQVRARLVIRKAGSEMLVLSEEYSTDQAHVSLLSLPPSLPPSLPLFLPSSYLIQDKVASLPTGCTPGVQLLGLRPEIKDGFVVLLLPMLRHARPELDVLVRAGGRAGGRVGGRAGGKGRARARALKVALT
jgi:hypothetical protein